MNTHERLQEIVARVERSGFMSVKELSRLFDVSEVTVRRDLQRLHDEERLQRTYGGAAALSPQSIRTGTDPNGVTVAPSPPDSFLLDQIDVLLAVSLSPRSDMILAERAGKYGVPIVAESLAMDGAETLVAVDNFAAAHSLGEWVGDYVAQHVDAHANVLDMTYYLHNTQDRSDGFMAGLTERLPTAKATLSLNTQADFQSAYQLATDALQVYPEINVIFGINDTVTAGVIQACQDLSIAPESVVVVTFGMEGDTLKEELLLGQYLKAGLAMFPEVVGPTCIEAAIAAFNHVALPAHIVTPHAVLSAENIDTVYEQRAGNWALRTNGVNKPPTPTMKDRVDGPNVMPETIGFLVPFGEHEWYINLAAAMAQHARTLGIELALADAAENLRDELVLRKRSIAAEASTLIMPGDVVLIDGGETPTFLAEALAGKTDITVITNSMSVIDVLRHEPGISLISTGGLLGVASQTLTGPTAEAVFRELRGDKLFLASAGISPDFGLSHTDLAEVAMKQAMIRAAREVILLADHTKFEQESIVQVAPLDVVDKLITDNALPASMRLDLSRRGIEVVLATG